MKHSVKVKIERKEDRVIVSNDLGATWEFPFKHIPNFDSSTNGVVAQVAAAMLTGTIISHLSLINSPTIEYTLTIDK